MSILKFFKKKCKCNCCKYKNCKLESQIESRDMPSVFWLKSDRYNEQQNLEIKKDC